MDIIQVLFVSSNSGKSKKTGNDYDMRMAQCIVHQAHRVTGVMEPLVGELMLPEEYKDIVPGTYEVEFRVALTREKRIESRVSTMMLVKNPTLTPKQAAAVS